MSTDFAAWASGLMDECATTEHDARACLVALTPAGRVPVVVGDGLETLRRVPLDRLALVPSTYGGMIATASPNGTTRIVAADTQGAVAVFAGRPGAWGDGRHLDPEGADHEALALLWLLMDVRATRPSIPELAARVLTWGWLASPVRQATIAAGGDDVDPGLERLIDGDVAALADLLGVSLPEHPDANGVRSLATSVDHPALDWETLPWVVSEQQRLDFLHACLPTRWLLADELRTCDGRPDLAERLMLGAPARAWWPAAA